jgi:hypothetical protein
MESLLIPRTQTSTNAFCMSAFIQDTCIACMTGFRQVRVADAKLDALIARGYLAADEREDAEAVQAALEAFLADRLSGGHLH